MGESKRQPIKKGMRSRWTRSTAYWREVRLRSANHVPAPDSRKKSGIPQVLTVSKKTVAAHLAGAMPVGYLPGPALQDSLIMLARSALHLGWRSKILSKVEASSSNHPKRRTKRSRSPKSKDPYSIRLWPPLTALAAPLLIPLRMIEKDRNSRACWAPTLQAAPFLVRIQTYPWRRSSDGRAGDS